MNRDNAAFTPGRGWIWGLLVVLLALFVTGRMGGFNLAAEVATPDGVVSLSNTFATVDHPFHVARADVLWREVASGRSLRWIGQHQGGYPAEFYPLGEAWLEVVIRAISLGTLSAAGAHTLAVIALLLLPGLGFLALGRDDRFSPAAGILALVLHISLPGGWYGGGYTELVQWGLVTNVAGAVAAFLTLPLLLRITRRGAGWAGASAAALAAAALYCNPRSIVALVAMGAGVWLATVLTSRNEVTVRVSTPRLAIVALLAAMLAAPLFLSLARFGDLYAFVRYSGYEDVADYAAASLDAVSPLVVLLAAVGIAVAFLRRGRLASLAAAASLLVYMLLTAAVAFVPFVAGLAPQLEPTRLMPLQRLLTIYLAAATVWFGVDWTRRQLPALADRRWTADAAALVIAGLVLVLQTRPLAGPPPDPASPQVPPVSLYPVAMSAQPAQADLEAAVRAADAAAAPGTALLVLGSVLSWHQPLWAPLWTTRPLFYDNWLWFWHPDHAGTPDYAFPSGNHYPDPEATLAADYLARHGIGGIVVTGGARDAAARSPLLQPLHGGVYDAYRVANPVTTITIGSRNGVDVAFANGSLTGTAENPAFTATVWANWHPRWEAVADGKPAVVTRRDDGYLELRGSQPVAHVTLRYAMQPIDWVARLLVAIGIIAWAWTVRFPGVGRSRWYAGHRQHRRLGGAVFRKSGDKPAT